MRRYRQSATVVPLGLPIFLPGIDVCNNNVHQSCVLVLIVPVVNVNVPVNSVNVPAKHISVPVKHISVPVKFVANEF